MAGVTANSSDIDFLYSGRCSTGAATRHNLASCYRRETVSDRANEPDTCGTLPDPVPNPFPHE